MPSIWIPEKDGGRTSRKEQTGGFKWIFHFHTYLQKIKPPTRNWLVGGSKYFLFSARTLGKISILTNIFQRGWNHQLAEVESNHPQFPFASFFRLAFLKGHLPPLRCRVWGGRFRWTTQICTYIYIHIICWYMNVCIYIYGKYVYIYIHVFMGTCVYIMCIYIFMCTNWLDDTLNFWMIYWEKKHWKNAPTQLLKHTERNWSKHRRQKRGWSFG